MATLREFKEEQMLDEEFRREYEKMQAEMDAVRAELGLGPSVPISAQDAKTEAVPLPGE